MVAFLFMMAQLTMVCSQPGALISQVLQGRDSIPARQNFLGDIVNKRPSSIPNIVLPPPTVNPPSPIVGPIQPSPVVMPMRPPSPVVIGSPRLVVIAPKPVVVQRPVVAPQLVVIVKPGRVKPVVSKKSGIRIVIVKEDDKCTTLEDILKNTPQFSILADALKVADLEQPKQKVNTIFAPVNKAFEDFATQLNVTVEQGLNDPNLSRGLLYHFVPGKLLEVKDLKNGQKLESRLQDQKLTVSKSKDKVIIQGFASNATIIQQDVKACDLIIHIVDSVLLPQV
eukprot:TRINITY_DN1908_c0_g2_i1.p1 TRINITY_DN1908_c0_g2~~TRINITY_DN1908_c0_g2_i1.p1  ORF type:complete len:282 (-),score=49.78 TRINITY_DN1908_c0_g2_i1:77-922(-)